MSRTSLAVIHGKNTKEVKLCFLGIICHSPKMYDLIIVFIHLFHVSFKKQNTFVSC